ncbi:MAG: hypothetical protein EHM87_11470 [Burkholderiales bacterium]|nr:MAG: hypothetical protein EHM87_11470 [Burkholderiales bacterium]
MGTIDGIRKLGFRKWYERQLIEGHVWLVTMVLALVLTAVGYEALSVREGMLDLAYDLTAVAVGVALSWVSFRRYASAMTVAEHVGAQAVCPSCGRYGFKALPASEAGPAGRPLQLLAACRGCGHRWPIDPGT